MRNLLAALAVVALSGCVAEETATTTGRLLGYCPQWVEGPEPPVRGAFRLNATVLEHSQEVRPGNLSLGGRPLDLYRLVPERLELRGGSLQLRAFTLDERERQLTWFDYRSAGQPFGSVPHLVFRGGGNETGNEFDTLLFGLDHAAPANATGVRLAWRFVPDEGAGAEASAEAEYRVGFQYRVCGTSR